MKIYLDFIMLINFFYDFIILVSVGILLHRIIKFKRLILATLIGEISLISIFVRIDNIYLLILKIILSIVMVASCYGFYDLFTNLFYFYIITIILGGSSYLFKGSDSLINVILLAFLGPIILFLYIKYNKKIKLELSSVYDVIFIDKNNIIKLRGLMDTGNNIKYLGIPIIVVNKNININKDKIYHVPYKSVGNSGYLECVKIDNVLINGKNIKCLVGLNENIEKDTVLLNNRLREII